MIMAAYYLVVGGGAWLVYQELLGWGAAQLDHGYSGPEESVPTESGQLVHGMTIYRTGTVRPALRFIPYWLESSPSAVKI